MRPEKKKKNLRQEQTCSYLKQLAHYSRTSWNNNLKKKYKKEKKKLKNIYFVVMCITIHTKITESLDSEKL